MPVVHEIQHLLYMNSYFIYSDGREEGCNFQLKLECVPVEQTYSTFDWLYQILEVNKKNKKNNLILILIDTKPP